MEYSDSVNQALALSSFEDTLIDYSLLGISTAHTQKLGQRGNNHPSGVVVRNMRKSVLRNGIDDNTNLSTGHC